MSLQKLQLAITAFRTLTRTAWDNGTLRGVLRADGGTYQMLRDLDDKDMIGLCVTVDGEERLFSGLGGLNDGAEVFLTLSLPRTHEAFFARDVADLLANDPQALHTQPEAYFLAEEDFGHDSSETEANDAVRDYLQTLKLVELLKQACDYKSEKLDQLKLVFFQKEKLELDIGYSAQNLLSSRRVDLLNSMLTSYFGREQEDVHRDQKLAILKASLIEEVGQVEPELRFSTLLNSFDRFYSRFTDNYETYVNSFSFDKIREEMDEKKLDFIIKINKVFAEIQNQLLGLPLAALLIATQMKRVSKIEELFINLVVLFGVSVFCLFMLLLAHNQNNTLRAIGDEVNGQEARLATSYPTLVDRLGKGFGEVRQRALYQSGLLVFVQFIALMTLFIAFFIFGEYYK